MIGTREQISLMSEQKIKRRRWNIKEVSLKKVEIEEKEQNKMVEIMADIFYHHICQPQEDQNFSDNSICTSKTLQHNLAA